ncbi:hypothetical protein [Rubritalea marina]|uniref:hypothetical protein n=1 Tax=Rubritalea marina TaxID=361055 RepID=UPI000373812A|nr:hypothetical protein [Rubritalea marina]
MICIIGNLPILQIGRYQVTGYSTQWIRTAIEQAAQRAHQYDFAFTEDIYEGIIHYMEHKCSLRLLQIEDLYKRIAHMLNRIGYGTIANALEPVAPPVTISLERAAQDAGDGFELAFYSSLQHELKELKDTGAIDVYFSDVKEGVQVLAGNPEDWNAQCQELEANIMDWLKKAGTRPEQQGYRIRASLKQLT